MDREVTALHAAVENSHWWFVARREIVAALLRRTVPPGEGRTVVDVGCGTGATLAALAGDYDCVGIDPSPHAVELARRLHPELCLVQGNAPEDLPPEAAHPDAYLLMDVLEHVPDDFLLFSSLVAACGPGAHILVTVPAHTSLWSPHDVALQHYRRYDRPRLEAVWSGLPVTVRLISYFNRRLLALIRAARAVNRARKRSSGGAGTDLTVPWRPVNRALAAIFRGERRVLLDQLDGTRPDGYRTGVSLVAVLRREPGDVRPRARPAQVPPDPVQPGSASP